MKSYQCSIHWVHHAIESPYNQQLSFANEPKTHTHTHTHTHTTVCFLFFVLGKHKQQTQPTSSRHPHKSSSVWQKALAGLSTCTPAGLKPRHLFWGPPRSQTGALPLTHHQPWGLGHNCVWKACSKLDTLSLIRLDNNNNNNSFIHSLTWCCCYSKRFRSCHKIGVK